MHPFLIAAAAALLALFLALIEPDRRGMRTLRIGAVAALLTILGYSLNDTVVIYDRIREMLRRYKKMPMPQAIAPTHTSASVSTHTSP